MHIHRCNTRIKILGLHFQKYTEWHSLSLTGSPAAINWSLSPLTRKTKSEMDIPLFLRYCNCNFNSVTRAFEVTHNIFKEKPTYYKMYYFSHNMSHHRIWNWTIQPALEKIINSIPRFTSDNPSRNWEGTTILLEINWSRP